MYIYSTQICFVDSFKQLSWERVAQEISTLSLMTTHWVHITFVSAKLRSCGFLCWEMCWPYSDIFLMVQRIVGQHNCIIFVTGTLIIVRIVLFLLNWHLAAWWQRHVPICVYPHALYCIVCTLSREGANAFYRHTWWHNTQQIGLLWKPLEHSGGCKSTIVQ